MEDRFSTPPIEVLYLINLTKIRIFASENNITLLKFNKFTLYVEKTFKRKITTKTLPFPSSFENPKQLFDIALKALKSFD